METITKENVLNKVEKLSEGWFTKWEIKDIAGYFNELEIDKNISKEIQELIINKIANHIIKEFDAVTKWKTNSDYSLNWHNIDIQIDQPWLNFDIDLYESEPQFFRNLEKIWVHTEEIIEKIKKLRPNIETNNTFIEEFINFLIKSYKALDKAGI